jgi:hypothetical protein
VSTNVEIKITEEAMNKDQLTRISIAAFALAAVLSAAKPAAAQDAKPTYAAMAPLEQYLMERDAEIALARTAAPDSVSHDAEVLVLGRHGFETAAPGKNGFVCVVERSWTSAADPEFWNPKVRTPICYNAPAARTGLARNRKRTELVLAGRTQNQVDEAIFAAVANNELPVMEPGAMCYMMSKQGYGGDTVPHWPSHLMFYFSQVAPAAWGANLPNSPVMAVSDPDHEHLTMFAIGVQRWSDGTEAPLETHKM